MIQYLMHNKAKSESKLMSYLFSLLLLSFSACALSAPSIQTSTVSEMPEPLTLDYALSTAERTEAPEIMSYSAKLQMALAEQDLAVSEQGVYAAINGRLRYVDPSKIVPSVLQRKIWISGLLFKITDL